MQDQTPKKKNNRLVAVLVIVIIILAILGFYSHFHKKSGTVTNNPQNTPASNQTMLPNPKTISPFNLTDDTGKSFTNDNLKGRWSLLFFGFTHCGDVCPLTLTELNKMTVQLQKELPPGVPLPQVVFISVDPERDNTNVLHNYVKNFNPSFIGATGDSKNLDVFVKDLGVFFSKVTKQDPSKYGIDHSSQLYLLNTNGDWAGILTYPVNGQQLANAYLNLAKQAS